jgi:hypothetical protein
MHRAMVRRRMFYRIRIPSITRKRCHLMACLSNRQLKAIRRFDVTWKSCLNHDLVLESAELDALERTILPVRALRAIESLT